MEKSPHKTNRVKSRTVDGFVRPRLYQSRTNRPTSVQVNRPIKAKPKIEPVKNIASKPNYPSTYINPKAKEEMNRPRRSVIERNKSSETSKPEVTKSLIYRRIVASILAIILIVIYSTGGYLGFRLLKTSQKVFGGSIISNVGDILGSGTILDGEKTGRVNILLAGDSADDPNHQGGDLTDSILILSINTKDKSAFLLSIPRDLWVKLPPGAWPGTTYQKINAANEIKNFNQPGYPKGGMGALSYVIQNEIGIPINYYGLINYTAFRDAVDAVGGVTITINSPDPRGLRDSNTNTKLPNGPVTLNGTQALNLARSRGDGVITYGFPNSDFNRTQYQRQLLIAVAQKAQSAGVVSNPSKISNLFNVLGNNISTNLNLADVLKLISIGKNINPNNVESNSFCSTMTVGIKDCTVPILKSYSDPGTGQSALSPVAGVDNYSQLAQYYKKLTSNNPVVKEGANVVVLNGTNTSGLATKVKDDLISRGLFVSSTGDASSTYPKTTIYDYSNGKYPATLTLLKSLYGYNVSTKQTEGYYSSNFVVVLGSNYSTKP